MKRQIPILLTNIMIVSIMLAHSAGVIQLPVLERVENALYDLRTILTMPKGIDNRVVIVDIDETSLREEGHWPWSRDKLAQLTNQLFNRYGVAALGFDVVFAEKDENREISALRQIASEKGQFEFVSDLDKLATNLDRDDRFAEAIANRPVTLGYYFNTNPEHTDSTGLLPDPLNFGESIERAVFPPKGTSYGANIPVLQAATLYSGFFSNPLIDPDGIVRRVPTLHEYNGHYYDSLAVAVVRSYIGMDIEPSLADTPGKSGYPNMEGIYVGPFYVPIDVNSGVLVPYRGPSGSFPYVSASDVLHGKLADPKALQDAIVLVGTTSLGLVDIRATPMQATFPGVEIHANIIAGIIDEGFRHQPAWVWGAEFAILIVIGILMMLFSPFLSPIKLWFFSLVVLVSVAGLNMYLWNDSKLLIPIANSILLVVTLYIINVMYGFFTEAKQKRQVRHAFSHYLAPALVDQLADDPGKLRLAGETREMTFLFTDIAAFTTFSEQTEPEVFVALLNEYLDEMCRITLSHGGTIDKFVGDAVIAMFNAPVDQPDHACRAVACAIEMDAFCNDFSEEKCAAGHNFGITRIGVHTGTVIVGNFGGSERFDYTALGDAVNTAARMESVNKHLGTRVCISGVTVERCPEQSFRPIGGLILKGKTEAVQAFEPLIGTPDAELAQRYAEAFQCLRESAPQAGKLFADLHRRYPEDPLVTLHHKRIASGEASTTITMQEK